MNGDEPALDTPEGRTRVSCGKAGNVRHRLLTSLVSRPFAGLPPDVVSPGLIVLVCSPHEGHFSQTSLFKSTVSTAVQTAWICEGSSPSCPWSLDLKQPFFVIRRPSDKCALRGTALPTHLAPLFGSCGVSSQEITVHKGGKNSGAKG